MANGLRAIVVQLKALNVVAKSGGISRNPDIFRKSVVEDDDEVEEDGENKRKRRNDADPSINLLYLSN